MQILWLILLLILLIILVIVLVLCLSPAINSVNPANPTNTTNTTINSVTNLTSQISEQSAKITALADFISQPKIEQVESVKANTIKLFNLSVRKTAKGYRGLVRGATDDFSYPYYVKMNNQGQVIKLRKLLFDYSQFNQCHKYYGWMKLNGIEDGRLFIFQGKEWGIVNVIGSKDQLHACVNTMAIFQISEASRTFRMLKSPATVPPNQIQKNWSPFEWVDQKGRRQLLCSYTLNPHIVLKIDLTNGRTTEFSSSFLPNHLLDIKQDESLKGGAPAILIEHQESSFYLGLGHTRRMNPTKYYHFFYAFAAQPPFRMLKISELFTLPNNENIQFATGLSLHDKQIYLSYGVEDQTNKIVSYQLADVLNFLFFRSEGSQANSANESAQLSS